MNGRSVELGRYASVVALGVASLVLPGCAPEGLPTSAATSSSSVPARGFNTKPVRPQLVRSDLTEADLSVMKGIVTAPEFYAPGAIYSFDRLLRVGSGNQAVDMAIPGAGRMRMLFSPTSYAKLDKGAQSSLNLSLFINQDPTTKNEQAYLVLHGSMDPEMAKAVPPAVREITQNRMATEAYARMLGILAVHRSRGMDLTGDFRPELERTALTYAEYKQLLSNSMTAAQRFSFVIGELREVLQLSQIIDQTSQGEPIFLQAVIKGVAGPKLPLIDGSPLTTKQQFYPLWEAIHPLTRKVSDLPQLQSYKSFSEIPNWRVFLERLNNLIPPPKLPPELSIF